MTGTYIARRREEVRKGEDLDSIVLLSMMTTPDRSLYPAETALWGLANDRQVWLVVIPAGGGLHGTCKQLSSPY